MSIALTTQPVVATAKLNAADVAALKAALQPLLTIPSGEADFSKLAGISVNVTADGTGVLSLRFSK